MEDGQERPRGAAQALPRRCVTLRLAHVSARQKNLLIVDGDEASRESLNEALRQEYRVMRAASAEGAFALLVRDEVDIAIVDVHQPGISGFELLRILRENYPAAEVIMTRRSGRRRRRRAGGQARRLPLRDRRMRDPEAVRSLVGPRARAAGSQPRRCCGSGRRSTNPRTASSSPGPSQATRDDPRPRAARREGSRRRC